MVLSSVFKRGAVVVASAAVAVAGFAGTASAKPGVPDLSYGSQGMGVKCVQLAVNWANAFPLDLDVDGVWGKQTQYGVVAFQRWKLGDAQADGIVGPNTGDKMYDALRAHDDKTAAYCLAYLPTH